MLDERITRRRLFRLGASTGALITSGCQWAGQGPRVIVYCSLDRGFAEPVLTRFQQETGIRVDARFDTESTKSVGHAEAIRREKTRPRCDLFWNNEPLHTARLMLEGLVVPLPSGGTIADCSFAARARILLVNSEREPTSVPMTWRELAEPKHAGQLAIAKPLFGTTATQIAAMWSAWGGVETRDWLLKLRSGGVRVLAGNKRVAEAVGQGVIAMGLTDTDDAMAELLAHRPVRIVHLRDEGLPYPFLLPNTLALIRGASNPIPAQTLFQYLHSTRVEQQLAVSSSRQIPILAQPTEQVRESLAELHLPNMPEPNQGIDWLAAAAQWNEAAITIHREFLG